MCVPVCLVGPLLPEPVEVDLFEFICEESRRSRRSQRSVSFHQAAAAAAATRCGCGRCASRFDCYPRLIGPIKPPIGARLIDARNGTLASAAFAADECDRS